jgi:hypothetical protein
MSTNIYLFNGTLLTTIADGTIDTTHSTLQLPGKGYQNYGEPVLQDIVWAATNFAGGSAPSLPIAGQTWYNTSTNLLYVYTGTVWQVCGGVFVSPTMPVTGSNVGAFWYDSVNLQLYIWDGARWDLLGPLGSAINQDPLTNTIIPSFSQIDSSRLSDGANLHQVWRMTIGGILFAIISKDPAFSPNPGMTGFPTLYPGINFNDTITGVGIWGDSTLFKSTKNNLPITDNTYNMGAATYRFANSYTVNQFVGTGLAINTSSFGSYALNVNGPTNISGQLTLGPGNTSNPPFLLTAGSLASAITSGALEFDGYNLWITLTQNDTLQRVAILAGAAGNVQAIPNTLALRDGSANLYADLFIGTATSAYYSDLAERYETDTPVVPGDVVILGGHKEITTSTVQSDPNVFGVISTQPALMMNADAGTDATHPYVALIGRVPCKVTGNVTKGQRLMTSTTAGVAMGEPLSTRRSFAFARSLVDKKTIGIETIEVVLLGRA